MSDKDFADRIASTCLDYFDRVIAAKGKPQPEKEWTVLSAFVQENLDSGFKVVALGTGTKCLGENEISFLGNLVHDSHAEVIAKRSLVSYFIDQFRKCLENLDSIFEINGGKFELKSGIQFHFYSSHPPCGDATIALMHDCDAAPNKRRKIGDDIHRTGAKSIENVDARGPGVNYHVTGAVRTKPGRGDPTMSLSCSDKMMKWNIFGIQGSLLLAVLAGPIHWSSITIGGPQFDKSSLQRALFKRVGPSVNCIPICHSNLEFQFSMKDALIACDRSLAHNCCGLDEVLSDGRKQGIVCKFWNTEKALPLVSRRSIARRCFHLMDRAQNSIDLPKDVAALLKKGNDCSYLELKVACKLKIKNDRTKLISDLIPDWKIRLERNLKISSFMFQPSLTVAGDAKTVLLLSGTQNLERKDEDKFIKVLRQAGYTACKVPVVSTTLCNQELLIEKILSFDYGGVILTSQNAAMAVQEALKKIQNCGKIVEVETFQKKFKEIPMFVVGESTHNFVTSKLGNICHGSESGNAENLARFISTNKKQFLNKHMKILFPCANLTDNYLQIVLKKDDISVDQIIIYDTASRNFGELSSHLKSVTKNLGHLDAVVFFSPSGVRASKDFFTNEFGNFVDTKFIALGNKTATELEKVELIVSGTCSSPNPESLLDVLCETIN